MCDQNKKELPQVSARQCSLTIDSDRVKAPVVDAGPKDSGGDQSHVKGDSLVLEGRTRAEDARNERGRDGCEEPHGELIDPFKRRDSIGGSPVGSRASSTSSVYLRQLSSEEASKMDAEMVHQDLPARRSSVTRTPPLSRRGSNGSVGSVASATSGTSQLPRREGTMKRSREDDSLDEVIEFHGMIDKLKRTVFDLQAVIKNVPNTKADIKKAVRSIAFQIDVLEKRCNDAGSYPIDKKAAKQQPLTQSVGTETQTLVDQHGIQPAKTRDMGTQTEDENLRTQHANRVQMVLDGDETFEGLAKILDKDWPVNVFKRVTTAEGNPFKTGGTGDIALVVDPKEKGERGIAKDAFDKFPEIRELIEEGCEEGQIEFISNETIVSRARTSKGRKRTVYLLPYKVDRNGVNDMASFHILMKSMEQILDTGGIRELSLVTPEGLDRDYVRKVAEHALRKSEVDVRYMVPKTVKRISRQQSTVQKKEYPRREDIIIKAGDKTYADLVRSLKDRVDIHKTGVKIDRFRKTAAGDLQLIFEKGRGNSDALGKEIRTQLPDSRVIVKRSRKTLHVYGLDATITRAEVEEELKKLISATEDDLTVGELRPMRDGNQAVTITVKDTIDTSKLTQNRVRIGWVNCRIRERVQIDRCSKCLRPGKKEQTCSNTDCAEICYNCSSRDHKASGCTKKSYCASCRSDEHRPDSSKCPLFRRSLNRFLSKVN